MKTYEKVEKTVTETRCIKLTCDICKAETCPIRPWTDSNGQVEEVEISYREGSSYPEGGQGTEIRVDLCPTCFTKKLIPWLESQGVVPTVKDWDY